MVLVWDSKRVSITMKEYQDVCLVILLILLKKLIKGNICPRSECRGMMIIFMLCLSVANAANAPIQFVVGAVPTTSELEFSMAWRPTFEKYLSEEVGKRFNRPVSFSLVVLNVSYAFDAVSEGKIDFIFANPSLYSCLDAEFSGT
jgi:hypothetical protein